MLYFMRHSMKAFVMWLIIAAFLGTIFYAWGMRSARFGKGGRGWVARVGEAEIAPEEYENVLRDLEAQVKDLPPELVKQLNLKEQALERLINQRLLLRKAERMGIGVSDQEIAASIEAAPAFQENGIFSRRAYQAVLAQNRMRPAAFERQQGQALRIRKLQDLIQDSVKVSEQEIREAYMYENEKVVVEYARIRFDDHQPDQDPPDKELQDYFAKHKEQFRTMEEINAAFCYITPQDFFEQIEIPEEEVERYYNDNKSVYVRPEKVHARHILIRVPRDADEETRKAARAKIDKVLKEARSGADFAELAGKYSEDSTASKGGDLGFFERGQMVESFDNAAFGLKAGEISPVVRTPFGYHVIKVEERQEKKETTLEEARPDVLRELKSEQGMRVVRREAMRLYAEIRKGGDFRKAVGERRLAVRETGYFSRKDQVIQGVPVDLSGRFSEEAFAAGVDGVGGVVKGEKGYVLLVVEDRKLPEIPPLEKVRTEVVRAVRQETAKRNAEEAAKEMVRALQQKASFHDAVQKAGSKDQGMTKAFTRRETVFSAAFVKKAFTLSPENPAAYVPDADGFYVMLLKEKNRPEETALEDAREEIRKGLIQEKKTGFFTSWLKKARKEIKVDVNQDWIDRM